MSSAPHAKRLPMVDAPERKSRPLDRVTFRRDAHGGAEPMRRGTDVLVFSLAFAGYVVFANAAWFAKGPLRDFDLSTNMVFDIGLISAVLFGCVLITRLGARLWGRGRRIIRPRLEDERGTIAVEFVLIFIPFFLMVGAVLQTSLLGHASLVCRYAAFSAARTAIVHTERGFGGIGFEEITDEGEDKARAAAAMVLAPLSPPANNAGPDYAEWVEELREDDGRPYIDTEFDRRVRFALNEADVDLELLDPEFSLPIVGTIDIPNPIGPRQIRATVEYPMNLVIPMGGWMLSPAIETKSGHRGNYFTIRTEISLQSTGPREIGALPLLADIFVNVIAGGGDGGVEPTMGRPF